MTLEELMAELDEQQAGEYNANCPHCGAEGELRGRVVEYWSDVVLTPDGWDTLKASPEGAEMTHIHCRACRRTVPPEHIYHSVVFDEECDCAEQEPSPYSRYVELFRGH